jgi:asparagine synthase (glutamine-hydrolysing)
MSGIVGIVHFDREPVDRRLIARMTNFLAFRGPDAQQLWVDGNVGLGHTLLRTTDEAEHERQPFTLDGRVWIVADARVDARRELIPLLQGRGHADVTINAPDVELILRTYQVWGEGCVEQLLGDFAFAIWDGPRHHLFCARDHMGVKPFYYAHLGQKLIFSNTLDCIRQHPAVSARLNDFAVADFLLFDLNQDKATTTFADIQRVPPAHYATWSKANLTIRRYWTLPIEEPIYYRRHDDYIDHFKELLRISVSDRLRTNRVGIWMSGGLDSPTLAATARELLGEQCGDPGVRAFTTSYDGYDEERHYSGLVATSLGIPIEVRGWSEDMADPGWWQTCFHTPEPIPFPNYLAAGWAHNRHVASYSRVAFFGEGPDNAFTHEWRSHFSYLVRRRCFRRLVRDLCRLTILHWQLPVPTIPRLISRPSQRRPFPDWINSDLEQRLQLRTRWHRILEEHSSAHPVRPVAYASFDLSRWQTLFEGYDVVHTRSLLEVRHPFLDPRLLRYMLAIPVVPWCRAKYLIRRAMSGVLPDAVLRRPKSPLVRELWAERVIKHGLPPLVSAPGFDVYVDMDRVRQTQVGSPSRFWVDFRTRSLNYWLQNLHISIHNNEEGSIHESNREAAYTKA